MQLPDECPARHESTSSHLTLTWQSPIISSMTMTLPTPAQRSLDGVKLEMRAGPPALEGRIVAAREKIRDFLAGYFFDMGAGQQRKHGWLVQAVRATVRSS